MLLYWSIGDINALRARCPIARAHCPTACPSPPDVICQTRTLDAPGADATLHISSQMYDMVELAEHSGVSRLVALYRLRNLGLLTEPELNELKRQEEAGRGRQLAQLLELPEPDHEAARNEYRHGFLGLGLEAFRRGEISRAKLAELAQMVGLGREDLEDLLRQTGLEHLDGEAEVLLPAE